LPEMAEGNHTLVVKAWDAANNSTEVTIRFRVIKEGMTIYNLMNYPNPFTANTSFRFNHNRPNTNLNVTVQIFAFSGKLVKTFSQTINTPGNRSSDIIWDGIGDYKGRLAPGVYIYRLQVSSAAGETVVKSGELVLF